MADITQKILEELAEVMHLSLGHQPLLLAASAPLCYLIPGEIEWGPPLGHWCLVTVICGQDLPDTCTRDSTLGIARTSLAC